MYSAGISFDVLPIAKVGGFTDSKADKEELNKIKNAGIKAIEVDSN